MIHHQFSSTETGNFKTTAESTKKRDQKMTRKMESASRNVVTRQPTTDSILRLSEHGSDASPDSSTRRTRGLGKKTLHI